MTMLRFNFQRACVFDTDGVVLNVGANEDPASLKLIDPDRVINCDIEAYDSYLDGRPNSVDVIMDAREAPWPFEDDSAELVVFGDILEHLYEEEAVRALSEAHRVAQKVCITVPEDSRFETDGVQQSETGYRTHCVVCTREYLQRVLDASNWKVVEWIEADYGFVPNGHFILAVRKED